MAGDINALLAQLETVDGLDATLKSDLISTVKKINTERGEFGSKLVTKDSEIATLKQGSLEYAKARTVLEKSGVSVDDIPALLEKLGVQKTLQEEHEFLKTVVKDRDKTLTETKKELSRLKAEKAVEKIFAKELAEFKDEEGKDAKVHNDFIDLSKLLDGIADVTDETVLTEKVKLALKDGYLKQEKIKASLGFPGAKIPSNSQEKKSPASNDSKLDIQKIMAEQGPAAAVAAWRSLKQG